MLKCELCKFESTYLEEVTYYDINGIQHSSEQDIERNAQNPDSLAHVLCVECAETFEYRN